MKLTIAALAASAALALAPVGAFAQHVDVGPGGVSVHGDRHHHDVEHTHSTVEEHHHDRPVVHDHHDDHHEHTTVIEKHGH
ncbi:hypothetical protein [Methylorubrum extorquens]|uniref:hypothetical protein n=1 Tax=Methylorubrum extorquens TaxID=408 RepID=UPI00059CF0DB|nr:hypothetical protein [Methylorubrum extorquens]